MKDEEFKKELGRILEIIYRAESEINKDLGKKEKKKSSMNISDFLEGRAEKIYD
jgi:hypothetical protein